MWNSCIHTPPPAPLTSLYVASPLCRLFAFSSLVGSLPTRPTKTQDTPSCRAAPQLVVASPPKTNSQAEKLGVKKGDLVSSINGLNAVNMDSFEVTDYLAKYQVQ